MIDIKADLSQPRVLAIAMGEILLGLYQEYALRLEKHEEAFVINDFGNVWYQDRYGVEPPRTEEKATTVNGTRA